MLFRELDKQKIMEFFNDKCVKSTDSKTERAKKVFTLDHIAIETELPPHYVVGLLLEMEIHCKGKIKEVYHGAYSCFAVS